MVQTALSPTLAIAFCLTPSRRAGYGFILHAVQEPLRFRNWKSIPNFLIGFQSTFRLCVGFATAAFTVWNNTVNKVMINTANAETKNGSADMPAE